MPKPTSKQADDNYSHCGTDNCERAGEQIVDNDYSLGLGFLAGLRLLVLRQFSAFLPALRRLRGALFFHGLRSSSIWGFSFWLLWLTGQSSRPAFGGRLTFVR